MKASSNCSTLSVCPSHVEGTNLGNPYTKSLLACSCASSTNGYTGHPTTLRRQFLFCVSLTTPCYLYPSASISAYRFLLHVFLGLSTFLFSWAFHCNAWLVIEFAGFRQVGPIQGHFSFFSSGSIRSCLVFSRRSTFVIFSGHLTFSICLKQL